MKTTLRNLLTNGDFEGTGWTGGTYDTVHVLHGQHSYRMDGSATTPEVLANAVETIQIDNTHLYYVRWYVYHEGAQGSTGCYFGIAEPSFKEGLSLGPANQWNLKSAINNRASFASGAQGFRFDYNNINTNGRVWFDGGMVIDLTACFGAGKEPSVTWCDKNIPFFIGETEISSIEVLVPVFIGLNPNPIECGESFLISAGFKSITVQDYTIPASAWKGTGPYYVDLSIQVANEDELMAYVADFATLEQRVAEYNALIQARENGTGIIRFWAVSVKPKVDIPVKVITGMFSNTDVVNIQPGQWQGSGPWTCSLNLEHEVRTATCAMPDGLTTEQARTFIDAGLHVAGVSGNTVTLRAMLEKPNVDVRIGILSE